ncbi:MAG TPA: hypothetical protein PLV52_05900, partial [Candidatus Omnitrophota bacterium]|nr:hypothetical protein [Candidatus Omnitrophota bacterium]
CRTPEGGDSTEKGIQFARLVEDAYDLTLLTGRSLIPHVNVDTGSGGMWKLDSVGSRVLTAEELAENLRIQSELAGDDQIIEYLRQMQDPQRMVVTSSDNFASDTVGGRTLRARIFDLAEMVRQNKYIFYKVELAGAVVGQEAGFVEPSGTELKPDGTYTFGDPGNNVTIDIPRIKSILEAVAARPALYSSLAGYTDTKYFYGDNETSPAVRTTALKIGTMDIEAAAKEVEAFTLGSTEVAKAAAPAPLKALSAGEEAGGPILAGASYEPGQAELDTAVASLIADPEFKALYGYDDWATGATPEITGGYTDFLYGIAYVQLQRFNGSQSELESRYLGREIVDALKLVQDSYSFTYQGQNITVEPRQQLEAAYGIRIPPTLDPQKHLRDSGYGYSEAEITAAASLIMGTVTPDSYNSDEFLFTLGDVEAKITELYNAMTSATLDQKYKDLFMQVFGLDLSAIDTQDERDKMTAIVTATTDYSWGTYRYTTSGVFVDALKLNKDLLDAVDLSDNTAAEAKLLNLTGIDVTTPGYTVNQTQYAALSGVTGDPNYEGAQKFVEVLSDGETFYNAVVALGPIAVSLL